MRLSLIENDAMMMKQRPVDCCAQPHPVEPLPLSTRAELVGLFKALGDATRLEIYRLIAGQAEPICVCDITDRFDVSQPTISHHLKVLREAGLVTVSRRGIWSFYAAETSPAAVRSFVLARNE
jgi:ArsR family transcriptional regulator